MFKSKSNSSVPKTKKKGVSPTIIIVGGGLIVGILIYKAVTIGKVPIEVANQEIPARTQITADMLKTITVSSDALPPGVITQANVNQVVGKISSTDIPAGMPISTAQTYGGDKKSSLTTAVPDGYVGMSLPVTNISGVSADISVNDRVNVYVAFKGDNNGTLSKLVLQNVQILAKQMDPNNPKNLQSVTVAVPVAQSEMVNYAIYQGPVTLAVVPYGYKEVQTGGVTDQTFMNQNINNAGVPAAPTQQPTQTTQPTGGK